MRYVRAGALLFGVPLLLLGVAGAVYADGDIDIIARLLQTPESTLALVALVLGVVSITVFVRANSKATEEADKITNRILDQYEKNALAADKNASAQREVALSVRQMVEVMSSEFAQLRAIQTKQVDAIRAQSEAVAETSRDFKNYQIMLDDTVDGLRQSVLQLVSRMGALEERTEQLSERAASAPGDHAKIITLLETLNSSTRQHQGELLAYLEERRAQKAASSGKPAA